MRKTVTFVPGSFKPPTKAHWDMILHYAGISDLVKVVVSAPKTAVRASGDGSVPLTPEKSKAILDVFKASSGADNVEISVSEQPSPVKDLMKAVSELRNAIVLIGTSDKGNDAMRYDWLPGKFADREDIKVMVPSETAFRVTNDISATDVRNNIGDFGFYAERLPDCLSEADIEKIRKIVYS